MSTARLMQMAAAGVDAGGGYVWTDPDLANASYDSVSFSVASQDTSPNGFYIGNDGRKLYLSGGANDSVFQYTLSTPWDLSTASYDSVSFSVSSQDTQPNGITFKSDGTIMYVSGNAGDDINQYSLSTSWDLSTASFASKTLSISSQDATPRGMAFNSDGSILLVVGGSNDTIFQYDLTTPWDISTGSYASKSFDTTAQETGPYGIYLSPNDNKFWIVGFSADSVLQYSVTSADISTASYDSLSFSVSAQETSPYTVFFKDDGSKMYVMGPASDTIYQYSTVTPSWTDPDLANASYDSVAIPASGTLSEPNSYGITFKPDGTAFYYCGVSLDRIQMYTLSTPWDLSTATYTNNYSVGSNPRDISFSDDGTKMFVVHSSGDKIKRYDLSTAWDVTTSSLNSNTYNPTTNGQPRGLTLEQSGTKLFITDVGNLRSYSLSTAYDLSTASVVSTTTLVANNYGSAPQFNPSGTKLWVISSNQTLKQYSLSTAWDISTLSGDTPSLSFTSQDGTMPGMYIKPDGSKVYAVGLSTDKVYQYSTD